MMSKESALFLALAVVLFLVDIAIAFRTATEFSVENRTRKTDDVVLEFVDPVSGEDLQQATDDTYVQLRLRFLKSEDGVKLGVSPFSCRAMSNEKDEKKLTDLHGCPVHGSPVGSLSGQNGTLLSSAVFPLASLTTEGHVTVTCSFEYCTASDDVMCDDRCSHSRQSTSSVTSHRNKRDGDRKQQTRTTSIRVLPSIGHAQNDDDEADSRRPVAGTQVMIPLSQSGPLLYLNPITCSLFLLLLSVFLALYVSFIRSLKRSVDEIKHEIEAQRSRDKFLVQ